MAPNQPKDHPLRPRQRGQRLILIAWLFMALVGGTLGFAYYSMGVLSAARAFVGGEGLWSKAQRDAIYALSRYASTRDEADYQAYTQALAVILGDRQFRLELEKPRPDMQISRSGLLQGRNHPDDVDGMISLFRNFRHVPEIDRAVTLWTQGDAVIDQLRGIGQGLHSAVQNGSLDDTQARSIQEQLHRINLQLAPLADAFSYSLGEASRRSKTLLLWTMFSAATLLTAAALVFSRRLVRDSESLQRALQEGEQQVQKLLRIAPFPMTITLEQTGAVLYANERALAQFKTSLQDLQHTNSKDFYCRPQERTQWLQRFAGHDSQHDWEVEMKDTQGGTFWALVSTQRIHYQGRECLLNGLHNIELRKRAQDALHHRAYHDELTGLPNRAMCMDALRRILSKGERKSTMFSIMFIDLDHFKDVNDSLGHEAGDQLLLQVAQRIAGCVRSGDLVARLGGDEFIVAIEEHHDLAELQHIADKILHTLAPAYMLCGHQLHVTASIGISTYPQDGTDLKQLLTHADNAMYQAKNGGRNHVSFFYPTLMIQLFWRRVRYLFICLLVSLLICIPLALAWAAYQAIDDDALLTQSAPFSPARMASAKRLLERNNPRSMHAGVLRSIQLGEDDLNLAAAYLASRYPHTRWQIVLQDGQASVRSSSFLPPNPFGNYLNMQAVLRETPGLPQVEHLLLGRLNVPPDIANLLLRWGLRYLQTSAVATASDSIRHVGLRNGVVTVEFAWNDALPAQLQAALVRPEEQARLQVYQAKLVELVELASTPATGRSLPLSSVLQPLLELAAQRSQGSPDSPDEYRAALVALAFYVNGKGLGAILPGARDWPTPVARKVTLGGRGDTAQHFSISAALAATAGSPLANAVGLYKELDDAQGGSGFSFNDLAADRAGTRLGELLIGNQVRRQNLQNRMAIGLRDTDLLPKVQDLPEDMQTAEFQKRFGGVDGVAYKKLAADIEQRIAALAIFR